MLTPEGLEPEPTYSVHYKIRDLPIERAWRAWGKQGLSRHEAEMAVEALKDVSSLEMIVLVEWSARPLRIEYFDKK